MNTVDKAKLWLTEAFDEETRQTVKQLIDTNSPELEDAFYKTWSLVQVECVGLWALEPTDLINIL